MSKKNKTTKKTTNKPQVEGAVQAAEKNGAAETPEKGEKLGVAGTAKAVGDNVLSDMLGVGEKVEDPELPEEEIELEVVEDRTRLIVQALGLLVLSIALLFVALGAWAAANATGNVALLLVILAVLTVVWFVCKAMGKRFNRFASGVHVVDFGSRDVFIYEKAEAKKALVVPYKKIKNYKLIRQGSSLRLLLAGDWVKHPSGFQLVDINRPFMKDSIDGLQKDIAQVMRAHRVNERK